MKLYSDKKITDSWLENADPWIDAIQYKEIQSRVLITDRSIVQAILERAPATVMDIGCGEGWLARELNEEGIDVLGIDIVPKLVQEATKRGGGKFMVLPFELLSDITIKERFDLAVCNFSLLGDQSVIKVFQTVSTLLNDNSYFIVQTIHPISEGGKDEYKDGWRKGSWKGFNAGFINPPPWYFRTLETWTDLFLNNGFKIEEIIEPINPKTKAFASIIFVGKLNKLVDRRAFG